MFIWKGEQINVKKSYVLSAFLVYSLGLLFLFFMPSGLNSEETGQYLILFFSYYYVSTLFFATIGVRGYDIFEPLTIYTGIYFLLYTVTPLVLFIQDNLLCRGLYVMDGCVKGTLLYMFAYTVFCLFYLYKAQKDNYLLVERTTVIGDEDKKEIYCFLAWGIWIITFFVNIYFLLQTGRGLSYILSFGFLGDISETTGVSGALFLTDIGYMIIGGWLYIYAYEKRKILVVISFILTIAVFYIRGFRFIVLIMLVAFATFKYLKNQKKPSMKSICALLLCLMFMIAFMGFVRGGLRTGEGSTFENFNFIDELSYALFSNFNIYQTYYGVIADVPVKVSFTYFATIWENIYMWIPRIIWPGKPATGITYIYMISQCMDYNAIIGAAMATPDLCGYYYSFGIFGVLFYSAFWGSICRLSRKLYISKDTSVHNLILYSLFMPTLFQMIIRGSDLTGFIKQFGFICLTPLLIKYMGDRIRYK